MVVPWVMPSEWISAWLPSHLIAAMPNGEDRFQAHGLIDGRLHVLVFTMRSDVLRAISLRKAHPREVKRYDEKA